MKGLVRIWRLILKKAGRWNFFQGIINSIYEDQGIDAYEAFQIEHEKDILKPDTAYPLVKALHNLNCGDERLIEIIIMSKNSANTSLRIFNSIEEYGLDITISALVGGAPISKYLKCI